MSEPFPWIKVGFHLLAPGDACEVWLKQWSGVSYLAWRIGDTWGASASFRRQRWTSEPVAKSRAHAEALAEGVARAFISWEINPEPVTSSPIRRPIDSVPELGYSERQPSWLMNLDRCGTAGFAPILCSIGDELDEHTAVSLVMEGISIAHRRWQKSGVES